MLPITEIIWHEWRAKSRPTRVPEPAAMQDMDQIRSYVKAYEWGGPTSALQLHHLRRLSKMIKPGDTVLDLACGPGPLLLELAPLYPDCKFIGADLSQPMLDVLREQAEAKSVSNIETLVEDIRTLPSLGDRCVDLVITTSALHHLPDFKSLDMTFERMNRLVRTGGGFYVFDFGLLRSPRTRDLLVAEVAKKAPPLTAEDYDHSLQAAFPIDAVVRLARERLKLPFSARSSSFVDFFYFLQTPARAEPSVEVVRYIDAMLSRCSIAIKAEHWMLNALQYSRLN